VPAQLQDSRKIGEEDDAAKRSTNDKVGEGYASIGGETYLAWVSARSVGPRHAWRTSWEARSSIPDARSVRERANTIVSDGTQRFGAPFLPFFGLVTLLQTATGSVAECT
jgi:hypothetical protein